MVQASLNENEAQSPHNSERLGSISHNNSGMPEPNPSLGISAIGVYEDFIGREVQKVVDFMVERPASWAQFEHGNLTSTADVSVLGGERWQRRMTA